MGRMNGPSFAIPTNAAEPAAFLPEQYWEGNEDTNEPPDPLAFGRLGRPAEPEGDGVGSGVNGGKGSAADLAQAATGAVAVRRGSPAANTDATIASLTGRIR